MCDACQWWPMTKMYDDYWYDRDVFDNDKDITCMMIKNLLIFLRRLMMIKMYDDDDDNGDKDAWL